MRGDRSTRVIARAFDRLAAGFEQASFLHDRTRDGLLERMQLTSLKPRTILDLGSATGVSSKVLIGVYPESRVVAADLSLAMALGCKGQSELAQPKVWPVVADYHNLGFRNGSFDLVFSNLSLAYCSDFSRAIEDIARVLRPGGLFTFCAPGPDTLSELRTGLGQCSDRPLLWPFLDMHIIADALVQSGLRDPVVDVERIEIDYADNSKLVAELRAAGVLPAQVAGPGYLGHRVGEFLQHYPTSATPGPTRVTVEMIYGHAWGGGPRGEARVPVSEIRRR